VAEVASATNPNCPLVLVADDEPDILELVRMVLEDEGYEVATTDNGATALRMANERRPDLCVLDVMMPEIDGYDVARVLKRDEELRSIPVILLTARTEPENVARGREAGADEYIAKPFLPEEFQNAVRSVLSARSAVAAAGTAVAGNALTGNGATAHPEPQPEIEIVPEPTPAAPPQTGSAVLLAGANQNLLNVARYRLELGGYQVTTADDAMRGVEMAAQVQPDVFVLDATMNDVDPNAVAQLLQGKPETQRVAFLTISNGGPFDAQDLFTRIETALGQR
jgi:DNA-binding response OmpR family regulator